LSNHVKIDIQDGLALMIASELGHLKVVELILAHPEAAMAVNQVDILKMTALMLAAKSKHLEIVKSLLAAGADVNLQDTYGCSALFYALDNRQKPSSVALVRELLIWKANIRIDINIGNASIDFKKQPDVIQCIQEHIKEQKNYQELQKEMKSFFAGKVKLSETKNSFFFPTAIINIVDEYASPTIEVRPAKK